MGEVREVSEEKVMFSGALSYDEWCEQNNDRIMNELEQSGYTREMGNVLEEEFDKRYEVYLLQYSLGYRPNSPEQEERFKKELIGMTPLSVPNICLAEGRKCGKLCFICTCADLQR